MGIVQRIKNIKPSYLLLGIVGIASILRLWGLGTAEIFHDEGFYAFRGIGYIDYLENPSQTTPVQWFKTDTLPWWTHLSFHDHPPLAIIVQYFFFNLFGDSLFIARLPSALAGIISVVLMYLILKKTFKNEYASLIGALLLGINQAHLWISRASLMESLLVMMILVNVYFFLKFLENKKYWLITGITLGLVLLTKYTGIFLIPAYILYLFLFEKKAYTHWQSFAIFGLTIVVCSPVLLFNYFLWRETGHFDLQFAHLFSQDTPGWQASLGKIQEPFSNIGSNLFRIYSVPFLILAFFGGVYSLLLWRKNKNPKIILGLLLIASFLAMLFGAGSGFRFIAMAAALTIWCILLFWQWIKKAIPSKKIIVVVSLVFIGYEAWNSINLSFLKFPDFGTVKLDQYFDTAFKGRRSLNPPQSPNIHLQATIEEFLPTRKASDKRWLIVYDENIALTPRLWLFSRRTYYHGISAITAGNFKAFLRNNPPETLTGYEVYFVKTGPYAERNTFLQSKDGEELELFLTNDLNLSPDKVIGGTLGTPAFTVYKFTL